MACRPRAHDLATCDCPGVNVAIINGVRLATYRDINGILRWADNGRDVISGRDAEGRRATKQIGKL